MKDLFSEGAEAYARYRPRYPEALYTQVLSFVGARHAAWDCATGNGQAALALADHFSLVEATDISRAQLQQAALHPRIRYRQSSERTPFPDQYFDLITIAQAYHWLDQKAFAEEARRVGRQGCVVAAWGYGLVRAEDAEVNRWLLHFYREVVGPFWDPERRQIDEAYRSVHFPFAPLPERPFEEPVLWKADEFLGYLSTWSAVRSFAKARGYDPVAAAIPPVWNGSQLFRFPLFLRLGRV